MEKDFLNLKRERPSDDNDELDLDSMNHKIKKNNDGNIENNIIKENKEGEIIQLSDNEEKVGIEKIEENEEKNGGEEKEGNEEIEEKGEKGEENDVKENYLKLNNANPNEEKLSLKEENKEDYLNDLIFQLNSKIGLYCFLCKKDISKNMKFICEQCDNQAFCINCLLSKRHPVDHEFHIADNLNYPLFTKDWKMNEEYKLLQNMALSGLNNWEDISNVMENKGQVECESHYYSFYYTEKGFPNPKESSVILDDNKNIIEEKSNINKEIQESKLKDYQANKGSAPEPPKDVKTYKKNGRGLCLRKNMKNGGAESAAEILGCRPKRNEFETEFLNDTEIELSHLEFDNNENEEELKIKYDVLRDYNLRIKEREERKKFVFEKGLLDLRRQNRIESKLSRDEFELLLFLKPFARFYENSEFFDLFEGLAIEQELKLMLKNLDKLEKEKNNKGEKICSIEEIENYFDVDKNINRTRKSGNLFTNISEPKNIMNLLGHRVERFLEYQKDIRSANSNENNEKKLFDEDEYNLVKEMPLARSTFYDIKKRANNLLKRTKEENTFNRQFNELLGQYDLEEQTKNDIYEFYTKKFAVYFKKNKDVTNINNNNQDLNNNNNANNTYICNGEKLLKGENLKFNDEMNNVHSKKINNYQELKTDFNNKLENEF